MNAPHPEPCSCNGPAWRPEDMAGKVPDWESFPGRAPAIEKPDGDRPRPRPPTSKEEDDMRDEKVMAARAVKAERVLEDTRREEIKRRAEALGYEVTVHPDGPPDLFEVRGIVSVGTFRLVDSFLQARERPQKPKRRKSKKGRRS